MDQLKIGVSSSSLVVVPNPSGENGIQRNVNTLIESYRDINNNLIVHITNSNKKSFVLEFVNKNKTDYEILEAYCNTPFYYFCSIDNGTRTIINGYYYLTILDINQVATTQNFLYNFKIDFQEK